MQHTLDAHARAAGVRSELNKLLWSHVDALEQDLQHVIGADSASNMIKVQHLKSSAWIHHGAQEQQLKGLTLFAQGVVSHMNKQPGEQLMVFVRSLPKSADEFLRYACSNHQLAPLVMGNGFNQV